MFLELTKIDDLNLGKNTKISKYNQYTVHLNQLSVVILIMVEIRKKLDIKGLV